MLSMSVPNILRLVLLGHGCRVIQEVKVIVHANLSIDNFMKIVLHFCEV